MVVHSVVNFKVQRKTKLWSCILIIERADYQKYSVSFFKLFFHSNGSFFGPLVGLKIYVQVLLIHKYYELDVVQQNKKEEVIFGQKANGTYSFLCDVI